MILGICTNMNARSTTDVGIDQINYLKKIGLEYVELSVERIMKYDENRFEFFRKDMAESPLPCLACNSFIDPSIKLVGRDFNKEKFESFIIKSLERIASIGAKKVVFGNPKARNIPSYVSAQDGRSQIIERIKYIAGIAEKHNIEVEVEHINRVETNVINTFEESVAIAQQINRPNVKSVFDHYHFEIAGEKEELVRRHEAWIGHMHFACTLERHMPDLDDVKKYQPAFKLMKDCSYKGTLSLEAYFPGLEMDNIYYKDVIAEIKKLLN